MKSFLQKLFRQPIKSSNSASPDEPLSEYESLLIYRNRISNQNISFEKELQLENKINKLDQLFYQLNLEAASQEKNGNINEAVEIYEMMARYATDLPGPYKRLAIIYRKHKRYEDEVRIIKRAVYVYTTVVYKKRADRIKKLNDFQERLTKAEQLLSK